jgi:hypothetical protein
MEYIYSIIVICLILWMYHRIKYKSSTYSKFEYYLHGINPLVRFIVNFTELVLMGLVLTTIVIIIAQGILLII